ncbi:Uncharacterised protein [Canicola haemoglobinophilus]|uniref:Uncharacterized protein n=1 Tax=Canicola haemoglobinophilus TaxID=733 RepID=A0A377HRE2_9PAST|nr:hypothetical protein [Canicola haemoglobinophilus]STO58848.1 Uncharacterised protein [Canicola haemoglobinophilus]
MNVHERKIIQITGGEEITALCNDGSVWIYDWSMEDWVSLAPIPKGEIDNVVKIEEIE